MSTNEVETQALAMGWIPEEKFRGDKAKWVDAETYVNVDKRSYLLSRLKTASSRRSSNKLPAQSTNFKPRPRN